MKQGFALQFSQNLSLTPALQQAIKLLQLSHHELQDELLTQVEDNPFLSWNPTLPEATVGSDGGVMASAPSLALGMQASPLQHEESNQNGSEDSAQFDERSSEYDLSTGSASDKDANDDAPPGNYLAWVQADSSTLREHLQSQLQPSDCGCAGFTHRCAHA